MTDDRWRDGDAAWLRLHQWHTRGSDDPGEALDALGAIERLRRLLDQGELAAVRAARERQTSWAEIATVLGVSRQSVWEKWRDLDDAPDAAGPSRLSRRRPVAVPDLVGLDIADALPMLTRLQLVAVAGDPDGPPLVSWIKRSGVVARQYPDSGTKLRPGSQVKLWVGRDGGSAGVREPRRPHPTLQADALEIEAG